MCFKKQMLTIVDGMAMLYYCFDAGYEIPLSYTILNHHIFNTKSLLYSSALGILFNPDTAWDEKKQIYKERGRIFKTSHICQSATGNKHGLTTIVIAASILML